MRKEKQENLLSPFGPVGKTGIVPVFNICSSKCSCSRREISSSSSPSSMGSPAWGPLAMALPISSARAFWSPSPSLYTDEHTNIYDMRAVFDMRNRLQRLVCG